MDLALHEDTHDLYFEDGQIATVDGPKLFAQQLRVRLRRQLGEWDWDLEKGIPYREEILVRNPDVAVVSAHFQSEILGTPGAIRLESFELEFADQAMTLEFEVVTEYGTIEATGETDDVASLSLSLLLKPAGAIL